MNGPARKQISATYILSRVLRITALSLLCLIAGLELLALIVSAIIPFHSASAKAGALTAQFGMLLITLVPAFLIWRFLGGLKQFREDRRAAEIARALRPTHEELAEARAAAEELSRARATVYREAMKGPATLLRPGIPLDNSPSWYGASPYYHRMTSGQIAVGGISSIVFIVIVIVWLLHGFKQDCTTTYTSSGSLSDSTSHITTSCK
jgi:hypothetical protein